MLTNRRYRRILATLLLLLYGFIMTPVALWHSHTHQPSHAYFKAPGTDKQQVNTTHSCIICEHAYAPYVSTEDAWLNPAPVFYLQYNQSCVTDILVHCTRHYNTRGSPAA
ncbi:hypothetical protein [Chitinophaga filiformis]|uniref:Uncharacterized protein n=1 Tax=Chitinophaga filiformis TaxID=104663 RepID=A0ABY4HXG0_CHIFI|nr:hypothetical protein [Chitinophaga filiformis]UPK68482.1 hypothetical protein MYF79_26355 [Chitinophaga filiformis]